MNVGGGGGAVSQNIMDAGGRGPNYISSDSGPNTGYIHSYSRQQMLQRLWIMIGSVAVDFFCFSSPVGVGLPYIRNVSYPIISIARAFKIYTDTCKIMVNTLNPAGGLNSRMRGHVTEISKNKKLKNTPKW